MDMSLKSILPVVRQWLEEDDLYRNFFYTKNLPLTPVQMELKIKSDLILSGTDYFLAVFHELGFDESLLSEIKQYEGQRLKQGTIIKFANPVPFAVAVTGERLALNLIHHASSISTHTDKFVAQTTGMDIRILDTRKTTPGLRTLEKYAVRLGGGHNHRFGQTDTWMVKDNHKTCLGGLQAAVLFFKAQGAFYNEIVVEVHNLKELTEAQSLGITRVMLDNFTPEDINKAISQKTPGMTYEVSGGISLANLKAYLIPGVDAISTSALVNAPKVDISLKYKPV